MVELLTHKTGGHLYAPVDEVADVISAAPRRLGGDDEHSARLVEGHGREVDTAAHPPRTVADNQPVRDETPPPATESHNDNPAPGQAEHFVLRLTQEDRSTFASLANKISLPHMISNVKNFVAFREWRGQEFSASEKRLIALLDNIEAEQGGKLGGLDLKFRWVSASQDLGVPQLVKTARVHGGAAPKDPWTHIGDGVVKDFMENRQGPGVLFVYDDGKLTLPTKAEIDADWADPNGKHSHMYAKKPKPGLELKDALVGMIRFDAPGDRSTP
ncbi:hypothetical protein [Nocardia sp. NBC_00403]|uniref:hypothetical protein n=1 Tax=Nocardia sp. NBC_00403 TaxID=2975990 RepID=UPI002E1D59A3